MSAVEICCLPLPKSVRQVIISDTRGNFTVVLNNDGPLTPSNAFPPQPKPDS